MSCHGGLFQLHHPQHQSSSTSRFPKFSPFFSRSQTLPSTSFLSLSPSNSKRRLYCSTPQRCSSDPVLAMAKRGLSFKQDEFASPADMSFQPPLKIVEYPDPLLRANNKPVNTFNDNLKQLVDEMFDVMYKTDGIGLSAPQVGINVQLMVFNPAGERGEGEELVLVNPRVNKSSQKTTLYNEGCLSFPGIYADVERPVSVRVDARDVTGARFSVNLSGLPARVFQHEFDHLQGILFFERMTEEVLSTVRADLQALEKKYENKTGFASPESIDGLRRRKSAVGFGKS